MSLFQSSLLNHVEVLHVWSGLRLFWFRESTPVQTDGTSGLADAGAKPKKARMTRCMGNYGSWET